MPNCCYTGAFSKFKLGETGSLSWIDFIEFDPYAIYQLNADGSAESIRGDLEHLNTDVDRGPLFAKYKLTIQLTPEKLAILLPFIGASSTNPITNVANPTNTFSSTSFLEPFDSKLETPNGSLFTFTGGYVNGYSVYGSKGGGVIRMTLDVWSQAMAIGSPGVETWANIVTGTVFGFTRGALTLDGTAREFDQFSLDHNFRLIYQHNNSVNANTICPTDSVAQLQTSIPYNVCATTTGLLTSVWGNDPVTSDMAGFLSFVRGAKETRFTFASLMSVGRIPRINKFNEIRLPFQAMCYRTSTTPMLTILNVP